MNIAVGEKRFFRRGDQNCGFAQSRMGSGADLRKLTAVNLVWRDFSRFSGAVQANPNAKKNDFRFEVGPPVRNWLGES